MLQKALLGVLAIAPLLVGCASTLARPRTTLAEAEPFDACERPLSLGEVARRAAGSDVVLIGEMHRHPLGLAVSAALYQAILARAPRAPLSLEFLERDTRGAVDDYLAGRTDRATFARASRLGAHDPEPGHLAMIDLAKHAGVRVIASNAPRAMAKKARVEGYDALRALSPPERALCVVPDVMPSGHYAEAFAALMAGGGDAHAGDRVPSFFRAQALWDATMADSIARAITPGDGPIVHVVGRFHVEHDGGLVQLLRHERPATTIFTIVLVEAREDVTPGLADVAIVVGPGPDEGR